MNNKLLYLIIIVSFFIQCRSNYPLREFQETDFNNLKEDLYSSLQKQIENANCSENDGNVVRSKEYLGFINWKSFHLLYVDAIDIYSIRKWDKMYFIYHFFDNTDPIFVKIAIVFSKGRKSWGLSIDDNRTIYLRTHDTNNINIWRLFNIRHGKFSCDPGINFMTITEFDNQYQIKRSEIYSNYGNAPLFDVLYRLYDYY